MLLQFENVTIQNPRQKGYIDGFVQGCSNSIANTLELLVIH